MYPCIPSWRIIYVGGATRPPTGRIGILSFLPSRLKVAFLSRSVFVPDYLRLAAKAARVQVHDGQRFGLHNLRHSLSNWLVNKARVDPKTVQGILRHSRIQTTLDLYTQNDGDEARGAQGKYLKAMGVTAKMVQ